jgi:DNA-binding NtrC family response regulator
MNKREAWEEAMTLYRKLTGNDGALATLPSFQEIEELHIFTVLTEEEGNKSSAAKILGIDRRTLYRQAERYGIVVLSPKNRVDLDKLARHRAEELREAATESVDVLV